MLGGGIATLIPKTASGFKRILNGIIYAFKTHIRKRLKFVLVSDTSSYSPGILIFHLRDHYDK
ncbi:hypothetical protein KY285_033805 [Solanum tuberosum]|nr:hypothetical protein KY285_033805 [Solanum tuberosum]